MKLSSLLVRSSLRLIVKPELRNESSLSLLASVSKTKTVFVNVLGLGLKVMVVPDLVVFAPFLSGFFGTP